MSERKLLVVGSSGIHTFWDTTWFYSRQKKTKQVPKR